LLLIAVLASAPVGVAAVSGSAGAQELEAVPIQLEAAHGGVPGSIEGPAAEAILHGPLPSDPANLARRKALAAQKFGIAASTEAAQSLSESVVRQPSILLGKKGVFENDVSPSDSTGAIGTRRYIELVNSQIGIYDVNLNLLNQDTLSNLFAESNASNFDPQVIWDATTNRFYYAGDAVFSSDHRLAFGFSKTGHPSNATTDWCHYEAPFGSDFPDFPKLGDSATFVVIGANVFSNGTFSGSVMVALKKPSAGTTCPSMLTGAISAPLAIGGVQFFTPVPANEIDSKAKARIVTRQLSLPGNEIGLFSVAPDASGNPVFPAGTILTVNPYDAPPNAPQMGTAFLLDTSDARMTQAVAALDPLRGRFAVWTQHTIAGGAGSKVRWYEIDPAGNTLLQSGNVKDPSLFFFNAAISPDRVVNGATTAFGSDMVLNFNASSSSVAGSIQMLSKRGTNPISLPVVVKTSTGPDIDFTCAMNSNVCRWGDYGAATPDPNPPTTGPAGIVWGSSMWTKPGVSWQTFNWKSQG
jgi:hypothetical protein